MVHKVADKADFEDQVKLAGDKLVVIDFFATWCGPCKMIAPILETLAQQHSASIVVLKVDVDECETIAEEYGISSMPTFVFLKNGAKVDSFSGANAEKLEKLVLQHAGL